MGMSEPNMSHVSYETRCKYMKNLRIIKEKKKKESLFVDFRVFPSGGLPKGLSLWRQSKRYVIHGDSCVMDK